jgi:hypothetical protein
MREVHAAQVFGLQPRRDPLRRPGVHTIRRDVIRADGTLGHWRIRRDNTREVDAGAIKPRMALRRI